MIPPPEEVVTAELWIRLVKGTCRRRTVYVEDSLSTKASEAVRKHEALRCESLIVFLDTRDALVIRFVGHTYEIWLELLQYREWPISSSRSDVMDTESTVRSHLTPHVIIDRTCFSCGEV